MTLQTEARGQTYIASFGGQSAQAQIHNKAWLLIDNNWQSLPAVPSVQGASGRRGAAAVVLDQQFLLFGGTGPGRNNTPLTLTDSYRLSPIGKMYQKLPDMPVAVYDAVAQTYRNRYVYLIGGNHQGGAINLVQVFDNFTQKWSQATPLPSTPLSRHSAIISANQLVVCGGTTFKSAAGGDFVATVNPHCFAAGLSPQQPAQLQWRQLPASNGAAIVDGSALSIDDKQSHWLIFAGGNTTIDAAATPASNSVGWHSQQQQWQAVAGNLSIQHSRYLLKLNNEWYSLGGINLQGQAVADFTKQQISLNPNPTP